MRYVCDLSDPCGIGDDANRVCELCTRPELFCACPAEIKRLLEGWDLRECG
jgi:hypothetical protein